MKTIYITSTAFEIPDNMNRNYSVRNNLEDVKVKGDWIPVVRLSDAEKTFRNMGDVLKKSGRKSAEEMIRLEKVLVEKDNILKKDGKSLAEAMTEISRLKENIKILEGEMLLMIPKAPVPKMPKKTAKPKAKSTKK